jgi:hypothetical protein
MTILEFCAVAFAGSLLIVSTVYAAGMVAMGMPL